VCSEDRVCVPAADGTVKRHLDGYQKTIVVGSCIVGTGGMYVPYAWWSRQCELFRRVRRSRKTSFGELSVLIPKLLSELTQQPDCHYSVLLCGLHRCRILAIAWDSRTGQPLKQLDPPSKTSISFLVSGGNSRQRAHELLLDRQRQLGRGATFADYIEWFPDIFRELALVDDSLGTNLTLRVVTRPGGGL